MGLRSLALVALTGLVHQQVADASAIDKRILNGVGVTPAMGWNNWNTGGGGSSTAAAALACANAFVSLGLKNVGYTYVNIDDVWALGSRSNGQLVPDPRKWPNGIKPVADQIHSMGLKFGLYGDSGTKTCSGTPGSAGYESSDARQLVAWGVDYWKYDNCNTPDGNSQPRYQTMANALVAAEGGGRKILYSLCNWGRDSVWTWGGNMGHSWRVTGDIENKWSSVAQIVVGTMGIAKYSKPGGFNDLDMLEVGNGGLSTAEERSHFGLWAILKSPLILGCDLTRISSASLAIIRNADVIAINQDSLGLAAQTFTPKGQSGPGNSLYPYYSGKLSDGYVIGLVAANGAATLSVNFSDVPGLGAGPYSWKELWTGRTGSGTSVSASLASHDMAIFKVTTSKPVTTTAKPTTTTIKTISTSSEHTTARTTPVTTAVITTTTTSASGGNGPYQVQYGQCGGQSYTGPTQCASPWTCHFSNPWYSQCY